MSQEDVSAITQVLFRYALAVDTLSFDLFDDVFTTDVHADFGGGAEWNDLASFKRDFGFIHAPFKATQHTTSNVQAHVAGDKANVISYVHGRFIREVDGGDMFESSGWYDDKLVRTKDGWRINYRVCKSVWCGGNTKVMEAMPGVTFKPVLHSLSGDAARGQIDYLTALGRR